MGMGPNGSATVSISRLLQFVAERMGIDSRIIATQEEQMAFFKQMQQQQMAEQQAAMAQQAPQGAAQ
jgi:hypothetical protein